MAMHGAAAHHSKTLHSPQLRACGVFLLQAAALILTVPPHNLLVEAWGRLRPWSDALLAAVGLAALLALALARRGEGRRDAPLFLWPALLFATVSVASALLNRVPVEKAVDGLAAVIPYVAVGLAAAFLVRPRRASRLIATLALCGGVVSVYGILSFTLFRVSAGDWYGLEPPQGFWSALLLYPYTCGEYPVPAGWRLVSTFLNENYLGVWLAMVAPVTWAWARQLPQGPARHWTQLGVCLMLVCFTWTYSRMAVLALCVALAGCWLWSSRSAWLLLLPVLIAAPLFLSPRDTYRFTRVGETEGGRIRSVQRAAGVLRTNPWLGSGPGTRGLADMMYAKVGHETGWLGLAAFAAMIVTSVAPGLRFVASSNAGSNRALAGALTAAMCGMAAAAVGGEVWENPQLAFTYWLFAGLLWRLCDFRNGGPLDGTGPRVEGEV